MKVSPRSVKEGVFFTPQPQVQTHHRQNQLMEEKEEEKEEALGSRGVAVGRWRPLLELPEELQQGEDERH